MKNKGFTLIELLAVIVILALLALLTSTAITKLVKDSKQDLSDTQMQLIHSAAKMWGSDNLTILPNDGECNYITLKDLQYEGVINSDIIDPKNNQTLSEDIYIKITSNKNAYGNEITNFEVNPESIQGCRYIYDNGCYETLLESDGTYTITNYYDHVFNDSTKNVCSKDVIIPSKIDGISVTKIYNFAFAQQELKSVVIPDSITYIGTSAFSVNELEEIVIPDSVEIISNWAFSHNKLNKIKISKDTALYDGVFIQNQMDDDDAFICQYDSDMSYYILNSYAGKKKDNVVIPAEVNGVKVKVIDSVAFQTAGITSVTIPNGVTEIQTAAFDSNNLTSVTIPKSVTIIRSEAFNKNPLTEVIIEGKSSLNEFEHIADNAFDWAEGYSDANIIFKP